MASLYDVIKGYFQGKSMDILTDEVKELLAEVRSNT